MTASYVTLTTNLDNTDRRCFDGAYEMMSGDFLVVWAEAGANVMGKYATRLSGAGQNPKIST